MKLVNSAPPQPASLLVQTIIQEEALITELVVASLAGKSNQVLAVSKKITALRTTQEAVAEKLLPRR